MWVGVLGLAGFFALVALLDPSFGWVGMRNPVPRLAAVFGAIVLIDLLFIYLSEHFPRVFLGGVLLISIGTVIWVLTLEFWKPLSIRDWLSREPSTWWETHGVNYAVALCFFVFSAITGLLAARCLSARRVE